MTNNPTIDGVSRERIAFIRSQVAFGALIDPKAARDLLKVIDHQNEMALKIAPAVERQEPDAIIEGCMTSVGITHAIYASTVTLKDKEQVRLYREPPEVAALQSTIAQLQALLREADDFMYIMTGDDTQKHLDAKYGKLAWEDAIVDLRGRIATAALNGGRK